MELKEKQISSSLFQFILPFSFNQPVKESIFTILGQQQFLQNQINDFDLSNRGFLRFSKEFKNNIINVFICPFEIGFIILSTKKSISTLSEAIEYGAVLHETQAIIQSVLPELFLLIQTDLKGIYVQSLLQFEENEVIDSVDLFRSGNLNGVNQLGEPYVAAHNPEYIKRVVIQTSLERWVPKQFYFVGEKCFTCLTTESTTAVENKFYQEHAILLLIHLFYKRVFLQISAEYANINLEHDQKKMGRFIYFINSFTSNYFFSIVPRDSEEEELFILFRKRFSIDHLYAQVKDSLESLITYDESTTAKRDSFLLLVLTLFTIVCGVFSTNLFEIERKIHLGQTNSFKYFQYFAVLLVFSGLISALFLGVQGLYQGMVDRRNRKKWVKESILSAKKP